MKFKVFFYDGLDYSTGKFYSAQEALNENFIEFKNNEIVPTDECSIIVISTGLKDINGVEIYEGDILEFPLDMGIAFVINDGFRFAVESPGSGAVDYESESVFKLTKIVGNIYENPF